MHDDTGTMTIDLRNIGDCKLSVKLLCLGNAPLQQDAGQLWNLVPDLDVLPGWLTRRIIFTLDQYREQFSILNTFDRG